MEGTKVFVLKEDRNVKVVYRTIDDCVTNESCSKKFPFWFLSKQEYNFYEHFLSFLESSFILQFRELEK